MVGPAGHRAYDLNRADELGTADRLWPTTLLVNEAVTVAVQRYCDGRPEFLRDADGDLVYFVHHGEGRLRTE